MLPGSWLMSVMGHRGSSAVWAASSSAVAGCGRRKHQRHFLFEPVSTPRKSRGILTSISSNHITPIKNPTANPIDNGATLNLSIQPSIRTPSQPSIRTPSNLHHKCLFSILKPMNTDVKYFSHI